MEANNLTESGIGVQWDRSSVSVELQPLFKTDIVFQLVLDLHESMPVALLWEERLNVRTIEPRRRTEEE